MPFGERGFVPFPRQTLQFCIISEPNHIYTSEVFCSHERNQIAFIYKMFAYLLLYTIALYSLRPTVLVCVHKPINAIGPLMRQNNVYCVRQTKSYINLEVHEHNKTAVYNF